MHVSCPFPYQPTNRPMTIGLANTRASESRKSSLLLGCSTTYVVNPYLRRLLIVWTGMCLDGDREEPFTYTQDEERLRGRQGGSGNDSSVT